MQSRDQDKFSVIKALDLGHKWYGSTGLMRVTTVCVLMCVSM